MKRKSPKQYTERFKKEAINLILEQGYTVQQAANALGITTKLQTRYFLIETLSFNRLKIVLRQ